METPQRGFEPPVAVNAESPVSYPPSLFDQGIEGTVVLQLFVAANGEIVPDSTRVAEGSGYPEFDDAALEGVDMMRFAPAQRSGVAIATSFLQPVHFRIPDGSQTGG